MKYFLLAINLAALLFTGSATAQDGVATIITSGQNAAQCISPMLIQNIDGQELAGGRTQVTVAPGKHVINGAGKVNTSFCRKVGVSRGSRSGKTPPLEAEFEADKTYYIGINHKASRESSWYFEIWNVEDSK